MLPENNLHFFLKLSECTIAVVIKITLIFVLAILNDRLVYPVNESSDV